MQAIVDQYHPTDDRPTVTKVRFAAEPTTRDDRNDDHLFNDADVSVDTASLKSVFYLLLEREQPKLLYLFFSSYIIIIHCWLIYYIIWLTFISSCLDLLLTASSPVVNLWFIEPSSHLQIGGIFLWVCVC